MDGSFDALVVWPLSCTLKVCDYIMPVVLLDDVQVYLPFQRRRCAGRAQVRIGPGLYGLGTSH